MSGRAWTAVAALAALRVWLTSALPLQVIAGAGYDDRLFVEHAAYLIEGRWLGPYGMLTLAKGPFYPMWIAALKLAGLPLLLMTHALYAAACLAVALALRPLLRGGWVGPAIFALLLFQPGMYHGEAMRVCRDGVYAALALLALAGAIGIGARAGSAARAFVAWAALLGVTLAALWLTREEGVWILPALAIAGAVAAASAWRTGRTGWAAAGAWAGGLLVAAALVLAVALVNRAHYGVLAITDVRSRDFARAFGSLMRVEDAKPRPFVAVSRAMRERLYAASPAFAELRPWLEGPASRMWVAASREALGDTLAGEIGTGWFFWALRRAVEAAGYYRDAPAAAGFYDRVAAEVAASCRSGKLACGPARASVVPPWRPEYLPRLGQSLVHGGAAMTSFWNFHAEVPPSTTEPAAAFALFRRIVNGEFSPADGAPRREGLRLRALRAIGGLYKALTPAFALAALAAALAATVGAWRSRRVPALAWVAALLVAAVGVRLVMLAYIEVTSFPAMNVLYLAPVFPLGLLLCAVCVHDGWAALRAMRRSRGSAA